MVSNDSICPREIVPLDDILAANLTPQEYADLIYDLHDNERGNPQGRDQHDEIMAQFFVPCYLGLASSAPARHMHLIDESYVHSKDLVVRHTLPRLCDAVATVLFRTHSKCLQAFLDTSVQTFEWHRTRQCVMIRREGNSVFVGTYLNFACMYIWTDFVRSSISSSGAWTETYAGVSQVMTPISASGVDFDKFESTPNARGILPTDKKYALFLGRDLGRFLLDLRVWEYDDWRNGHPGLPGRVEWEADGVVTVPKDIDRYQLGEMEE